MTILDCISAARPPWLYSWATDVSALTNWAWNIACQFDKKLSVRWVRGKKMRNWTALFSEFSAALQFPYYFGENLDAFDECITDLAWLNALSYLIIILDADEVLVESSDSDSDFRTLLKTLNDAASEWAKPITRGNGLDRAAKPFHVIFHAEHPRMTPFELRLARLGLNLPKVAL
jgi:RNAse (barnase) inhibitor barstar